MGFYDQGGMARVRAEDLVPLSVKNVGISGVI